MPRDLRKAVRSDFETLPLQHPVIGVFHNVDAETLERIASKHCEVAVYDEGEFLFGQHQITEDLPIYIVLRGAFVVIHRYPKGGQQQSTRDTTKPHSGDVHEVAVAFDASGAVIGEVERLLIDVPEEYDPRGIPGSDAKSSIRSITESTTLIVRGSARDEFLNHCGISKNMNRLFALKLLRRSARGDAMDVFREERHFVLAAMFRRLANEPEEGGVGTIDDGKITGFLRVNCRLEQTTVAQALGVSTQVLTNAYTRLKESDIARFRSDGMIYLSKPYIDGSLKLPFDHLKIL